MRLLLLPCLIFLFCGFTFRISEDLGSLDWGQGEVSPLVVQQLMEGLTTSGPRGEPVPALARRWSANARATRFTFELRRGARWSDGEPVCARQFVDAWTRVLSPGQASPYAHLLFDIENARDFNRGAIKDPARLGLKAVGCSRLEVRLEHPAGYFPALTSHWVLLPVRLDLMKKFGAAWTEPAHLAVTGPYVLSEWRRDEALVLKRNPRYYGTKPSEETLRALVVGDDSTALGLFRAGKLDFLRDLPFLEKPALSKLPEYSVTPAFVEYHLGFAFSGGPGAPLPRAARCALSLGLDRREIPELLKGGERPAAGVVPPELAGTKALPRFDASAARRLWESAGVRGPVEAHYYTKDVHGVLMQWAQQQWRANLGADVRLVPSEGKVYWSDLQRSPPALFLSGITASYAHPYIFLSEFLSGSKANWGHFSSTAYDAAAARVAERSSPDRASVARAEKILLDDECAVVPLYFRETSSLLARGWHGLVISPMTYVYMKGVSLR